MDRHNPEHLTKKERTDNGSFYTPRKFVDMAGEWLHGVKLDESFTFIDSSCGGGAFFELTGSFPKNRFIGSDIDIEAVDFAGRAFPSVETHAFNALQNISRSMFCVGESDRIVMIGNPPYNDTTSIVQKGIKRTRQETDESVKARDVGCSFLKSFNILRADYVLVLHPLSYLIKKANFSQCLPFFENYRILKHLVFSSQEFHWTSRISGFPIVMALYERCQGNGLRYEDIKDMTFDRIDGGRFTLSGFDFITDRIDKYPTKKRYDEEYLFYTMRDINALRRSRTFIKDRCRNAVDVNPDMLAYYCYIDCFKKFEVAPYWMGNLDVPFDESRFQKMKDDFVAVSKKMHEDVFGPQPDVDSRTVEKVRNEIARMCGA